MSKLIEEENNLENSEEKIDELDFEKVYETYYPLIYKYLLRMLRDIDEAEEIAQETFTRYFENPNSYNKKEFSLKSFLYLSAKSRAITNIRKNKRRSEIVFENKFVLMANEDGEENVTKKLENYDQQKAIYEALSCLKENYRDAIMEVCIKSKTYKEAAEALNISEANLKVTLHRAKIKLSQELEKKGFKDYFINFLIIGLIVFGLTCTYNVAKKKIFSNQHSYTYNDNCVSVNIEVIERYKHILEVLNIQNDGSIKTKYIPMSWDSHDLLHVYNDKFEMRIFNDKILKFVMNEETYDSLIVTEENIADLDKVLYNDEIREIKTVANTDYKMINVIVSDEKYRIYIVNNDNKLIKIRNMEKCFIDNTVELDKDEVAKIVKEEYGEDIEIQSIELTQTRLNVLMSEGEVEEYHQAESIDKYKDMMLAKKNLNYYLVWKVEILDLKNVFDKEQILYIDVYSGRILKKETKMY